MFLYGKLYCAVSRHSASRFFSVNPVEHVLWQRLKKHTYYKRCRYKLAGYQHRKTKNTKNCPRWNDERNLSTLMVTEHTLDNNKPGVSSKNFHNIFFWQKINTVGKYNNYLEVIRWIYFQKRFSTYSSKVLLYIIHVTFLFKKKHWNNNKVRCLRTFHGETISLSI